jgi:Ca2+-binding EF-hand superfamily protein
MVGADEDVLKAGIDIETHLAIAQAVLKQEGICESTLESRIYEALDVSGKGFVTVEDLKRVFISTGRARLANSRAEQLFAQLDDLNIGKISVTQMKQKLRGGRTATCIR